MNNNNENLIFFSYARKSEESEDRQVQSIEDQNFTFKNIIKKDGLKVLEMLSEEKSARKPGNRPIFQNMIERIENGETNAILC